MYGVQNEADDSSVDGANSDIQKAIAPLFSRMWLFCNVTKDFFH